jgi:hypothetical protein
MADDTAPKLNGPISDLAWPLKVLANSRLLRHVDGEAVILVRQGMCHLVAEACGPGQWHENRICKALSCFAAFYRWRT